jgi:hypothetical protein
VRTNPRLQRLVLCVIAAGCGGGASRPPALEPAPATVSRDPTAPRPADYRGLCRGQTNEYACGRAIERFQIERAPERVARRGDTLIVRLADGNAATFVNRNVEDDTGVWYTYREYLPAVHYHLVAAHLYEGTAYVLTHHDTGGRARIQALPVFSPDGARFATASEDLESGYNPTAIQIWRVVETAFVLEWSFEPAGDPVRHSEEAWGPGELRWISPTEIRVQRVRFDPETYARSVDGDVVIRLVGGRWRVVDDRG